MCNYYFANLVKTKKLETKIIIINEKNYKNLTKYFTRFVQSSSIKMLSLHYHELMGKIKDPEGKNYLMVNFSKSIRQRQNKRGKIQ